ncbi:hypothetical protein NKR23_g9792 [Pleurostoma richardsiae]|uniref:Isochorismatase-like domain-containing protein n=1 Tax=Pleurostoma richardsiae TaxID=41990 RepID=A0AA38VEP3_9PEZI|nr:hypothetical protein NKR23_g9792 [Pleurostoma richardsiae]
MNNPVEKRTAFLVMDLINGIIGRFPNTKEYLDRVAAAVTAARARDIPVIHITIDFRPGYPEISPRNKFLSTITDKPTFVKRDGELNEALEFPLQLAPLPNDIVVSRKRISAFSGSDLEVVLRSKGINDLVLAGFATSGVVLSTVREAMDRDYSLTVLEDLCFDPDEEVHRVLAQKVFPLSGDVVHSSAWMKLPEN